LAAATAFRRAEMVAAEVASLAVVGVTGGHPRCSAGFKKEDADPTRMASKRKADEGFLQNPNNKKDKNNEASSDEEEEEYPRRWPDFDWRRPISIVPLPNLPLYNWRTHYLRDY